MIRSTSLVCQLEAALAEVTAAENVLELALQELRGARRADKVTVSDTVETAFARVRAARAELAKLRDQVDNE